MALLRTSQHDLDPDGLTLDGGLPVTSITKSSARTWVLNGSWAFRYFASLEDAPDDPKSDEAGWGTIGVPSSWPLQGFGKPAYTNIRYPFPVDPPRVPRRNPTGDYRRTFTIDDKPARSSLRFEGVDGAAVVWLNGERLGEIRSSRLRHQFDTTTALVEGENTLVVRVVQWSSSSYLEDQDMWWLPGIFRDVAVDENPVGGIIDVEVWADFDAETGLGILRVTAQAEGTVRVSCPELRLDRVPADRKYTLTAIEPWTAEAPRLYEVVVETATHSTTVRVGFRRVTTHDGVLRVNGAPVLLKGVNRHEHHPDTGRVVPLELVRAELQLMKRHNINAIRTSHYPPNPEMLHLADELGFYVIDECDLETHGFELVGWRRNPSSDPVWREHYLDRIRRTVERDKNHPSVIMWSLGNESHTGDNLAAMAHWVRHRDPHRPIHYEGDQDCAYVDIWSQMYTHPDDVAAIGRRDEPPLTDARADARRRGLPFVLCEYAHAMGNGPGGLSEYLALFRSHERIAGGFVWEWVEHGIRTTQSGESFMAYGGDFGEPVHDGNFVIDGLVSADREPRPGLADLAVVYRPVDIEVGQTAVTITNWYDFSTLDHLAFVLSVDGSEPTALTVPPLAAGERVTVALPASNPGARARTVSAVLAAPSDWAPAGHEVAWGQRVADAPRPAFMVGTAPSFDEHTGIPSALADLLVEGVRLELWRAPTDNDDGIARPSSGYSTSIAERWREAGLDRLLAEPRGVEHSPERVRTVTRYSPAGADHGCELTCDWSSIEDQFRLDASVTPFGDSHVPWGRIGLRLTLGAVVSTVTWTGLGPGQGYPDTGQGARFGTHSLPLEEFLVHHVYPQESGARRGVEHTQLTFSDRSASLVIASDPLAVTIRPWSTEQVGRARHERDLVSDGRTHVVLDLAQRGVGTASCGPDVLPRYELLPRAAAAQIIFSRTAIKGLQP